MKVLLLGLFLAIPGLAQTGSQQKLEEELHARDPQITIKALKRIAGTKSLYEDPSVQNSVIQLLSSETVNPDRGELAETQQLYEDFYGQLLDTTKAIAVRTNNRQAWLALARANYNADAEYGRWLAIQPQAIPAFIQLSSSPQEMIRGQMLCVMAYTIKSCNENPRLSISGRMKQLETIIRRHAAEDPSPVVTSSEIVALGICGTMADIPLLESLRGSAVPNQEEKYWLNRNIDTQEQAIRGRFSAK